MRKSMVFLFVIVAAVALAACMTTTTKDPSGAETTVRQLDVQAVAQIAAIAERDVPAALAAFQKWQTAMAEFRAARTAEARAEKLAVLQALAGIIRRNAAPATSK
jgi:hypothetical protein